MNPDHPTGFHTGKSFNKKMILPAILRNWYWFGLAAAGGIRSRICRTQGRSGQFQKHDDDPSHQ
jgi:hypothetical protein